MDVLAGDGVILNNYYVQQLCTPSRAALMTGLYPIHNGLQDFVIQFAEPNGLPLNLKVMPQFFKDIGYETHMIGKWHLGYFRREYTPTYRGFDSFYGYYGGEEDYYNHSYTFDNRTGLDLWLNTEPLFNETGNYSTHLFTERAKFLIKSRNAAKPFFLYLAYQSVHGPLEAPEENVMKFSYIGEENRTIFAGIVDALDQSVGEVLETLYEADMLDNTIIVLSTDNGGLPFGNHFNRGYNFPLRGAKGTLWEGGTRGSAFIWSPLLNQNRRVSDQMLHITDWLPTLYSAAGKREFYGSMFSTRRFGNETESASETDSTRSRVAAYLQCVTVSKVRQRRLECRALGARMNWHFREQQSRWKVTSGARMNANLLDVAMAARSACRLVAVRIPDTRNASIPVFYKSGAILNFVNSGMRQNVVFSFPRRWNVFTKMRDLRHSCFVSPIFFRIFQLVDFLRQRLQSYASSSIAPLNKPTDPRGYPENLNGTWGPWIQ
ncbi:unnamed protein product [Ixodes persulcatus]